MVKIVFVCLGNICRSPSGEGVFTRLVEEKNYKDKFYIDSAGTSAYHVGEQADSRMRKHAARKGYRLESRSRQFITDDFNSFDYIIAMDSSNYRDILKLDPSGSFKNKVHMMCDFSKEYFNQDIPDPYYGGPEGFDTVITMLEEACSGLLDFIVENEKF